MYRHIKIYKWKIAILYNITLNIIIVNKNYNLKENNHDL